MKMVATLIARYPRWLAVIAGGVSATGFAPLNLWPLTLLCLAVLMHLIASANTGKRAFMIGWLFGVGHFSVGNNWIATAFTYQAAMPAWLGWIAVVLLALYLAVYPALACWGTWWVSEYVGQATTRHPVLDTGSRFFVGNSRLATKSVTPHQVRGDGNNRFSSGTQPTVHFILAFAGCWIISEWLRSWVFTGFAWNPLSAVWIDTLWAQMFLPIIGAYGFSGITTFGAVLLLNAIYWVSQQRAVGNFQRSGSYVTMAFVGIFVLPVLAASFFPHFFVPLSPPETEEAVAITIVQPNISQLDKHTAGYEAVNFSRLAQNSDAKNDQPRLLLWPEAAIPWWLEDDYPRRAYYNQPGGTAAATRAILAKLLGPKDLLLTGGDRLEFAADGQLTGARNSMLAMDAKGEILSHYDKAHLVPYGEYLALRWLLEPLGATRLVPGAFDFLPGPGPRTLDLPFNGKRIKVGVQICYEIIFSGQVVDRSNRPDFIFQPSNDAWYGSWSRPQFLVQARLRAIEEGLPVVRSTPTGISAVIDADGHVVASLPSGRAGRIDTMLPIAKAPTLFALYGNILSLGFAALLIALAFLPLARRRISR